LLSGTNTVVDCSEWENKYGVPAGSHNDCLSTSIPLVGELLRTGYAPISVAFTGPSLSLLQNPAVLLPCCLAFSGFPRLPALSLRNFGKGQFFLLPHVRGTKFPLIAEFGGRASGIRQMDYCINILHFLSLCVCVCVWERESEIKTHCVPQVCEFTLVYMHKVL